MSILDAVFWYYLFSCLTVSTAFCRADKSDLHFVSSNTVLHKPLCVTAAGLGLSALCKAGQQTTQCVTDKPTRIGVDIAVALAAVYFAATYMLLWLKLRWFKKMPYAAVKKGIVYFTLQVWYL